MLKASRRSFIWIVRDMSLRIYELIGWKKGHAERLLTIDQPRAPKHVAKREAQATVVVRGRILNSV